jgi:plasmid stabilization system protein ParE
MHQLSEHQLSEIFYRVQPEVIQVLRVLDAARDIDILLG